MLRIVASQCLTRPSRSSERLGLVNGTQNSLSGESPVKRSKKPLQRAFDGALENVRRFYLETYSVQDSRCAGNVTPPMSTHTRIKRNSAFPLRNTGVLSMSMMGCATYAETSKSAEIDSVSTMTIKPARFVAFFVGLAISLLKDWITFRPTLRALSPTSPNTPSRCFICGKEKGQPPDRCNGHYWPFSLGVAC